MKWIFAKCWKWGPKASSFHTFAPGRRRGDRSRCKFPPLGRRGAESNVRAAAYGGPGFNWPDYIAKSNDESLIIPMAEDFEFADNVDEILSVDGTSVINFGPIDYSLSAGLPIGYTRSTTRRCLTHTRRLKHALAPRASALCARSSRRHKA